MMTTMMIRSYSELKSKQTFLERYHYLALSGRVGESTFGFDRELNQQFYTSREWRQLRHYVIVRDNGCDLGIPDYEIHARLLIHHMNPLTLADFSKGGSNLLDPEFLITTTHATHNAIHYGDEKLLPRLPSERKRGDTKLW